MAPSSRLYRLEGAGTVLRRDSSLHLPTARIATLEDRRDLYDRRFCRFLECIGSSCRSAAPDSARARRGGTVATIGRYSQSFVILMWSAEATAGAVFSVMMCLRVGQHGASCRGPVRRPRLSLDPPPKSALERRGNTESAL